MSEETTSTGGRPRKGTLVLQKRGWAARIWTQVDGEWIRVTLSLGTMNKAVARRKMARLVAEANAGAAVTAGEAKAADTFKVATERVHKQRVKDGVKDAKNELHRLRAFAFEEMGDMPVTEVQTLNVNAVLDAAKAAGKSRQTVAHLRQDIRNVLAAAKREGTLASNPADDAEMPKFPETVRKERAVLTDPELARYLAWQHPDERYATAVLERQTMACIARMFGGLRTGDLHALVWEALDVEEGAFAWGWAPRKKTKRPQLLEVPAMLRPILRDWWERHGRPRAGLVFPARRGERAGEAKAKASHADALRRDLARAFGIQAPERIRTKRSNGRPLTKIVWRTVRDLTPRERELFEETAYTLPLDFHSWRRAFSQALAEADVNAQQATALTGHASLAAHARYLANSGKLRRLPKAALPKLGVLASSRTEPRGQNHENRVGVVGFELTTSGTQSRPSTRLRYTPMGQGFSVKVGDWPGGKARA